MGFSSVRALTVGRHGSRAADYAGDEFLRIGVREEEGDDGATGGGGRGGIGGLCGGKGADGEEEEGG